MREFNVTGLCVPEEDYMVDISGKIEQIKAMVDKRSYFTINRARQYGKTTTLAMLKRELSNDYFVAFISFEGLGDENFATSAAFCDAFTHLVHRALLLTSAEREYVDAWLDSGITDFMALHSHITRMCSPDTEGRNRKIVLMIDEVDKTSNNVVFLHFLGMLREKFLARKQGADDTFHSVILAGVYDIKNIKLKMLGEGLISSESSGDKIYNSPWNIAADFEVDMSFSPDEIATMLSEYEADHATGMDIPAIADEIRSYTGGYPFLVSRICQIIDTKLGKDWTLGGVQDAVKVLLFEKNTLFDDVFMNIENSRELYDFIYSLLIEGDQKRYTIHDPVIDAGVRYGFLCNKGGEVAVSNKIFELLMVEYYISKDLRNKKRVNGVLQRDIVKNGKFDMELCMVKFAEHYAEIYNEGDIEFLEKQGRLIFLSYLRPLINGDGFYHMESQFTDLRRMDLVVDYGKEQFIIELKIWRGEQYEADAIKQLCGYLDSKRAETGYLLTFDFRKAGRKSAGAKWVEVGGKRIFSVVV
ncbi:MAG: AAA-like domain-containing protein [Oscillospiraceae bacterium]|nr:AAA-like domain-containing protein [Oscillospiraceae bacterium]